MQKRTYNKPMRKDKIENNKIESDLFLKLSRKPFTVLFLKHSTISD